MNRLIVLMIDGVAAEHYTLDRARFPHFAALEARGFRVERLHSEVLGTSLPGRTSMMTGVTADVSGVYGNKIWDAAAGEFRYATPDDVRVPTLPARAKAAGKKVAVVGFGMIRPEDTDIMQPPWWVSTLIQRPRDAQPEVADNAWLRVAMSQPANGFAEAATAAGLPLRLPVDGLDLTQADQRSAFGNMADQLMFDWVGALAVSGSPPDVIIAEFLMTDTIQHYSGYRSELSQWSVLQADAAVGRLVQRLTAAGVLDQWNIAVMSDHGHSPIERALQPQVILPSVRVQCEGGSLLVAPRDDAELHMVAEKLAEYDVRPFANDCIPAELREQVFVFVAPPLTSFENDHADATEAVLPPSAISSHGLMPGMAGDDRFALFAGPNVPQGAVEMAKAVQVAPTLAALAGLPGDGFMGEPIFTTVG